MAHLQPCSALMAFILGATSENSRPDFPALPAFIPWQTRQLTGHVNGPPSTFSSLHALRVTQLVSDALCAPVGGRTYSQLFLLFPVLCVSLQQGGHMSPLQRGPLLHRSLGSQSENSPKEHPEGETTLKPRPRFPCT